MFEGGTMFAFFLGMYASLTWLGIAVSFVFALIIMGLTVWALLDQTRWWIPAIVVVVITTAMAIFFHSWWFVLWAFLLALVVVLVLMAVRIGWKILWIFLAVLIMAAGLLFTNSAIKFAPKATNPSESAPVTTTTCTEAVSVESMIHGDKVLVDLNDGDPFDYSLTIVNPDQPSSTKTLVVLTEPGSIFDVVYPKMYFTSYRLRGTLDQALCSASKLAGDKALAYVFVGDAATPKGWTTFSTKGWWTELVAKKYSDVPITPGGDWTSVQIGASDKVQTLSSDDLIYGQVWNPNKPGIVVHFQIESGYEFAIPAGWQGTYWTVTGADPVLVQDRFVQATKEVVERDGLSISGHAVTLFYCGQTTPTTELKIGADTLNWTTSLIDLGKSTLAEWSCTVKK